MRSHTNGTHTRSAATVRDGEGLVQVEVHQVKAQITWPDDAKQRVEIRAITVHQATAPVYQLNDLFDVLIEETERVRVSQHHADNSIVTDSFERSEVNVAACIRWNLHNLQSHHPD